MSERDGFTIVGIGADGWPGLGEAARAAVAEATRLVGGARQLALVPPEIGAARIFWPAPLAPYVAELVDAGQPACILASGDPLLHGVGALFARRLPPERLRILPHVSAFALACARLGWPQTEVALVSAVARPLAAVRPFVQPDRRLVVYAADGSTPAALAALLRDAGYGRSAISVLAELDGPGESRRDGTAASWTAGRAPDLCVIAVRCIADPGTPALACIPGLPDGAFETDGQLTKREVRAATLARLVPLPGRRLWDVGGGSGSIAIEWMRVHPSTEAIVFERRADRVERIARNAEALGVPGLRIVTGEAPETFSGMPRPDAVFIGGGLAAHGMVEAAWDALGIGGRLTANAVTIAGEAMLAQLYGHYGGELVRIAVSRADLVGAMPAWRPLMPVTLWSATKR